MEPRGVALFTGDSVTDCGRRDDLDGLGDGYVRALARSGALADAEIVNTGVGGDRVRDVLARVDADVLRHAPSLVSILVGVNDMWRRFDADDPTTEAEFRDTYVTLLERIAAPGRTLVLVEPFLVPRTAEQVHWRTDLDPKIEVVRELARATGAVLVPADAALAAAAVVHGAEALTFDGVHPTPLGHRTIADTWIEAVERATVAG